MLSPLWTVYVSETDVVLVIGVTEIELSTEPDSIVISKVPPDKVTLSLIVILTFISSPVL